MKAISLWQPWASAMALGFKRNETRHWEQSYRGPLLIHAAKTVVPWTEEIISFFRIKGIGPDRFPMGCLICKVDLVDIVEITQENAPDGVEYMFGNYAPGRYMWQTSNLETFKPIPWKGRQGLFNVPWENICRAVEIRSEISDGDYALSTL